MKKKALALAVCMTFTAPTLCVAMVKPNKLINLGKIQSKSNLNEPFKAVIPIFPDKKEHLKKLKVRLAPAQIFEKLGLKKLSVLDGLKFRIGSSNHKPVIVVSSKKPIQIQLINFVLEIKSTEGKFYQHFTALIDSADTQISTSREADSLNTAGITSEKDKTAHEKSKSKPGRISYASNKIAIPPKNIADNQSFNDSANELKKTNGNLLLEAHSSPRLSSNSPTSYVVKTGDCLSKIAKRLNTGEVSLALMMDAIHSKNPTAFINNDINKLKRGAILRIPSLKQFSNNKIRTVKVDASSNKNDTGTRVNNTVRQTMAKTATDTVQPVSQQSHRYTVKKGDTLSSIIKKSGYTVGSFTKTLKTIHHANPHAFSRNNINRLKIGSVLIFPDLNEKTASNPSKNPSKKSSEKEVPKKITITKTNPAGQLVTDKHHHTNHKLGHSEKEFLPKTYLVKKGDTISQVVKETAYKNVSFTKMMKAIYAANQHAFEKSNITILKEGAIIQVPPLEEITKKSKKTASASKKIKTHRKPLKKERRLSVHENVHEKKATSSDDLIKDLEKRVNELRGLLLKLAHE